MTHNSIRDPRSATIVPTSSPSPTVFVVDDDPAVLKGLSRLLRSEGLTVATFSSAREFLERYDSNWSGCLILDVAMPEMNGLELQQVLIAGGQELAIVFLTGHGDIPMRIGAIKDGAVDFLNKPVNDVDLLNAVYAAIERDRLRRQKCEIF
jgi:FixJ family two-component response regulator